VTKSYQFKSDLIGFDRINPYRRIKGACSPVRQCLFGFFDGGEEEEAGYLLRLEWMKAVL
jgi:hypothetical protein